MNGPLAREEGHHSSSSSNGPRNEAAFIASNTKDVTNMNKEVAQGGGSEVETGVGVLEGEGELDASHSPVTRPRPVTRADRRKADQRDFIIQLCTVQRLCQAVRRWF